MPVLFTPWRFEYLTAPKGDSEQCIFCHAVASVDDDATLTLLRTSRAIVMLNRYPYTNGHIMIAPAAHQADLYASEPDTLFELIGLAAQSQRVLSDVYHPEGFNIGLNLGAAAGAGIADHYHIHVVPRWGGDTNFMSVTAQTRIVPESLDSTLRKLRPKFAGLSGDSQRADE